MIWIQKTIAHKIDYKFRNDRILEARLRINREYLTIFSLHALVEGKDEKKTKNFMKLSKRLLIKLIKMIRYLMLMGDLNARVGNSRIIDVMGTNGEAVINNNVMKLIRLLYIKPIENNEYLL